MLLKRRKATFWIWRSGSSNVSRGMERNEKTWHNKYFPEAELHVKVDSFIRRTGLRTRSYIQ